MARKRPTKKPPQLPQSGVPVTDEAKDTANTKLDKLKIWRGRAATSEKIKKDWEQRYDVEKCERYLYGDQEARGTVINHYGATIRTTKPNLYYAAPKFYVRPKPGRTSTTAKNTAAIGEGVLEAIGTRDDNLERTGELCVLQAFSRIGVMKVVYDPTMVPNPNHGQPVYMTTDTGEPIVDDLGAPISQKNPLTGKAIMEPADVLTDEVYRWQYVDAANMLLPAEGADAAQWTWIGEKISVPLEDAQADTRFNADYRKQLKSNITPAERRIQYGSKQVDLDNPDDEMVAYYECYDFKDKRWYAWADGQAFDDFLFDEDLPAWIDRHPYALLMLGLPILGPKPCPWPYPVTRDWLYPQDEYNTRRKQMQEGAKRSARKGVYFEQTFDNPDEAVKLLQSPDDMVFAKVTDPKVVPIMLDSPDLNASIYKDIAVSQADWRTITGQTGARLADPENDTATEASFVERAANLRESDMQRVIARWMSEAGRKMLQCVKATLTMDTWIKLRAMDDKELQGYIERVYGIPAAMLNTVPALGEAVRQRFGEEKWVRVTREKLQFEADVTVVPGSTRPKNLDFERRQWLEFLKVLGTFPQLALSPELLRYTAEKFEGLPDRVVEELAALAKQMVNINANQAGRNQGSAPSNGAGGGGGVTADPSVLSAITGGTR